MDETFLDRTNHPAAILKNCEECGHEFMAGKNGKRITALFCSERCRAIAVKRDIRNARKKHTAG